MHCLAVCRLVTGWDDTGVSMTPRSDHRVQLAEAASSCRAGRNLYCKESRTCSSTEHSLRARKLPDSTRHPSITTESILAESTWRTGKVISPIRLGRDGKHDSRNDSRVQPEESDTEGERSRIVWCLIWTFHEGFSLYCLPSHPTLAVLKLCARSFRRSVPGGNTRAADWWSVILVPYIYDIFLL